MSAIDQRKTRWLERDLNSHLRVSRLPEDASSYHARANEFFVGRLQCQINMKLVFRISEDGSEIVS